MKNIKNDSEIFYVCCLVGMAFSIILFMFYAPNEELKEQQAKKNIVIVEQLVEEALKEDKKHFMIEVTGELLEESSFIDLTSRNLKCSVYTKGKRFEILLETKQLEVKNIFKPVHIEKLVEY